MWGLYIFPIAFDAPCRLSSRQDAETFQAEGAADKQKQGKETSTVCERECMASAVAIEV